MDESRFRQQLEARNKSNKKNEKRHGKNFLCDSNHNILFLQMILTTADSEQESPTLPSPRLRRSERRSPSMLALEP